MQMYSNKQKSTQIKVWTRTKKATNDDVTAFVAFLMEHCLYSVLWTFMKGQSQQRLSAFQTILYDRLVCIKCCIFLHVVNSHKPDGNPILPCNKDENIRESFKKPCYNRFSISAKKRSLKHNFPAKIGICTYSRNYLFYREI